MTDEQKVHCVASFHRAALSFARKDAQRPPCDPDELRDSRENLEKCARTLLEELLGRKPDRDDMNIALLDSSGPSTLFDLL